MLRVVEDDGGQDAVDVAGVALVAGVPYVRGWADAEAAAELLRAELAAWGIAERMRVRAHVSDGGAGVVELGWVSPQLAALLAGLLAQARADTAAPPTPPAHAA